MKEIQINEKIALTIEEASLYSNIGRNTLRSLTKDPAFERIVIRVGNKILLKRKPFEEFIEQAGQI